MKKQLFFGGILFILIMFIVYLSGAFTNIFDMFVFGIIITIVIFGSVFIIFLIKELFFEDKEDLK